METYIPTILAWLPIVIISLFGFFARNFIRAKIDSYFSIKGEKQLAILRSELDAEKGQLSALRDTVLNSQAVRQTANYQRQLEAIEVLWNRVQDLDRYIWVAENLKIIKIDTVSQRIEEDAKLQEFFQILGQNIPEAGDIFNSEAPKEPFVPSDIWITYKAYENTIMYAVVIMQTFKIGANALKYMNNDFATSSVKLALPSYEKFLDEQGYLSPLFLHKQVKDALVDQIRVFYGGDASDHKHLEKAALITNKISPSLSLETMKDYEDLPAEYKAMPQEKA
jgi:hypothetical protein